jgi:hypothetical protein
MIDFILLFSASAPNQPSLLHIKEEPDLEIKQERPEASVAPPWWKSAELFPPIHKQKKEDEEVPVAPPCWQSEEHFSPAHTPKRENEVGKKLVAPPWRQAGELLPPATSQEIGAGEIPLAPAGCFKCALEFKNRSSKFIYTHYCIHFQKALLALGKKMYFSAPYKSF